MINPKLDRLLKKGSKILTRSHDFVEMGGLRWATCNVGAEKPTDLGLYFSWGKIKGYTLREATRQNVFFELDEEIYNGNVLNIENDAVHANWGGLWRMPTEDDFINLLKENDIRYVTNYLKSKRNGLLVTDKNDPTKSLFFPSGGFITGNYNASSNIYGDYWTASFKRNPILFGFGKQSSDNDNYWLSGCNSYYGFQLRGVIG